MIKLDKDSINTSYFGRMKSIKYNHLEPYGVSIARSSYWIGETYPDLFPTWEMINLAKNTEYSKEFYNEYKNMYYEQVLSKLDPEKVYNDLKGKLLLCHETSQSLEQGTKYCHRRIVAEWLEKSLGIEVKEI